MELRSTWDSTLCTVFGGPYSPADLVEYAEMDYTDKTGEGSHPGWVSVPSDYKQGTYEAPFCYGGSAAITEQCANSPDATSEWKQSLLNGTELAPLTIDIIVQFADSTLIKDATVRAAFTEAAGAYMAEQTSSWEAEDKCPNCNSCGSCSGSEDLCTCDPSFDSTAGEKLCSDFAACADIAGVSLETNTPLSPTIASLECHQVMHKESSTKTTIKGINHLCYRNGIGQLQIKFCNYTTNPWGISNCIDDLYSGPFVNDGCSRFYVTDDTYAVPQCCFAKVTNEELICNATTRQKEPLLRGAARH